MWLIVGNVGTWEYYHENEKDPAVENSNLVYSINSWDVNNDHLFPNFPANGDSNRIKSTPPIKKKNVYARNRKGNLYK